jgi:hypothetical protein
MIPARETLRAAFDAAIEEINGIRGSPQVTSAFCSKIGAAILDACSLSREEAHAGVYDTAKPYGGRRLCKAERDE